ncbi:glutathione S-transferase 1-like [Cloeon dipterum]|uniref:glutathione S-transferase 1-like n=1 Tax=Cloeon dipterum TaxID=197152 RepID=UPI003220336A
MGSSSSKSGKLVLYYDERSAPCRAVLLTAAALNIKLKLKRLDLLAKETLNPDFVKINPQHCLPTLKDGDFVLWESRAILQYLVNQYGKADNALYPLDPKKRALVDARLNFDAGYFHPRLGAFMNKFAAEKVSDEESVKKLGEALDLLNTFLEGNEWVACETATIADISLAAGVSNLELFEQCKLKNYPNVVKWLQNCKKNLKGYDDANQKGIDALHAGIQKLMASEN